MDLLGSFEITLSIIPGYSSGEITAAYAVGALSYVSAVRSRGLLSARLEGQPGMTGLLMIAVGLS